MNAVRKLIAPVTWVPYRLRDCLDLINGRAYSQTELLANGRFRVIRIQNLNGGLNWYFSDLGLQAEKYCESGDLLFAWSATFGPYIWRGPKAIFHYHIWKVIPKSDVLDSAFAYYLLLWVTSAIRSGAHGIAMLHFSKGSMENYQVDLPDLDEQRRIAAGLKAQLAAVEGARLAAQAQVAESTALRDALYRAAFAGIVPVAVPPDFVDAPARWQWSRLGKLARLESGHTPSRSRSDWWGGDTSWLSLTEIRALDGRWVESTQLRTNSAGIANSAARVLPRGTVCFSRTASVGFAALMAQPMATSQDFANWVCGDELDPEFLMHALIRARKELRAIATGATHKTIYMPALASFHLCLPERAEQERIVARLKQQLEAVETLHRGAQQRLAEIERLPARLLAQAFNP